MRRHTILFACLLLFPASAAAAPADPFATGVWTELSGRPAPARAGTPAEIRTRSAAAFDLDHARLRDVLDGAASTVVSIPMPDGTLERFRATEAQVLAPALGRRFPGIRTYTARGLDDPGATAVFDLTPLGFHASVRSEDGLHYVDPRYKGDRSVYASYFRDDLVDRRSPLAEPEDAAAELAGDVAPAPARAPGDPVVQRTYRLALANDPSYATYFGSTDALVEAAKATLISRVNQLYNDDLAIRMQLVGNDNLLNFDTSAQYAAAGYTGVGCDSTRLTENDAAIDTIIGSTNYDIGHIVGGADFNGGGIAELSSVGGASKGRACTGLTPPTGDGFAVDYVAHEMGHQFGGQHTFDGVNGSCAGGNRTGTSAVEPGSGSSIQAYAGICGVDDLQPNSDPYFSQQSVDEILGFATSAAAGTNEGFTVTQIANRSPVVAAPPARTIPVRTPFTLPGSATDADGDALVYLWEQNDTGGSAGQALLSNSKPDGPLFRVFGFRAVADPQVYDPPGQNEATEAGRARTFPDAAQVAADNTNAESGGCSGTSLASVDCFSEFLPTGARTLNFRLTARDRDSAGGGLSSADVAVGVAGTVPFAVTAPAGPANLTGGQNVTVTWNVADTTAVPVCAASVQIAYSTDGGLTFGYEVLASTANDGSESVKVPNVATATGRFRVAAIDNYFFDVSDGDLSVTALAGTTPTPTLTTVPPPLTGAPTCPAPSATPTVTPTVTSTPTSTVAPSPTPTPTAPAPAPEFPGLAALAPDLRLVAKALRQDGKGRVTLRVRCKQVTAGTRPALCAGRAAISYRRNSRTFRAGDRRFSFGAGQVGITQVKLNPATRRRLRSRSLKAKVRATVGTRQASRKVTLRRRL
ncbi:MAG: reprolysin-like metallopeptidase [Solirubrobacteraceae bacterium]